MKFHLAILAKLPEDPEQKNALKGIAVARRGWVDLEDDDRKNRVWRIVQSRLVDLFPLQRVSLMCIVIIGKRSI